MFAFTCFVMGFVLGACLMFFVCLYLVRME